MSLYKTCPVCGANLDPGERCDCEKGCSSFSKRSVEMGRGLKQAVPVLPARYRESKGGYRA